MKRSKQIMAGMAAIATVALPGAVRAQSRPALVPDHDVVVTYRLTSNVRNTPDQVRIIMKAGGRQVRIEPQNAPGYGLIDRAAHRADMVLPQPHLVMKLDIGQTIDKYLNDPAARFRRLGPGSVAGRACTRWAMHAPEADGEGCVTADGVILQAAGHNRRNEHGTADAIAVTDAPQPDSLFKVPAGYGAISLSGLSKSLTLPQ